MPPEMNLLDKLTILTDAAKYDASCTSSGVIRGSRPGMIGNTSSSIAGCCHSFSANGRCISLLKVLMTNYCVYDCKYCINRRSNDTRRTAFTPRELAELTVQFYRRNYIEGLFLSSGVLRDPDYTTQRMIETLRLLRREFAFNGYIHAKAIPGADPRLIERLGMERENVIACGDGLNDLAMIRYAGLGVAMGNACGEALNAADYVTASVDDDGIRKALEKFGVI